MPQPFSHSCPDKLQPCSQIPHLGEVTLRRQWGHWQGPEPGLSPPAEEEAQGVSPRHQAFTAQLHSMYALGGNTEVPHPSGGLSLPFPTFSSNDNAWGWSLPVAEAIQFRHKKKTGGLKLLGPLGSWGLEIPFLMTL